MIGEMLDKAISVVSPSRAAKRTHARTAYRRLSTRAYDAAKRDRRTSNWKASNRSADLELLSDADAIRARARDLVRNNAYAKGVLRALVRNVVGCGIKPEPRIELPDGTPNERANKAVEKAWNQWQKSADVTGRLTFYEIQSLCLSETFEAGELLVRFVETGDRGRDVPFALELVEADRLAGEFIFPRGINSETGNEVRRGVEIDSSGRPVAYWLYPTHPNDLNTSRWRAERFPAHEFIHLFRQERIGQTRGISIFAPIVRWLRDLHYYVENELQASAVASCFSVAIKTFGAGADAGLGDSIDTSNTDTDGNQFEYLQPGGVERLFPGEDIETINPSRPNSDAGPWINLMLRSIGVGVGLSYERLSRDYSQTTFSSNRASDLEDRREFRPMQDWLVNRLCVPVWERFMVNLMLSGTLDEFPDDVEFVADFNVWTAQAWQPPGWEWVDPVKEASASINAIENNLSTLADETGKRGKNWRDVLSQRAVEKATEEALSVPQPVEQPETEVATNGKA